MKYIIIAWLLFAFCSCKKEIFKSTAAPSTDINEWHTTYEILYIRTDNDEWIYVLIMDDPQVLVDMLEIKK